MTRYFLSIGTNLAPREERMRCALDRLSELEGTFFCSTPYATSPIGKDSGDERKHYLNVVGVLDSDIRHEELNALLKRIETDCGRNDASRLRDEVPIDIDIVIAGGEICRPKDFACYFFRQGYEELLSLGF